MRPAARSAFRSCAGPGSHIIKRCPNTGRVRPASRASRESPDIWIPKKGESIDLTLDNIAIYERPIKIYEKNDLAIRDGKIFITDVENVVRVRTGEEGYDALQSE